MPKEKKNPLEIQYDDSLLFVYLSLWNGLIFILGQVLLCPLRVYLVQTKLFSVTLHSVKSKKQNHLSNHILWISIISQLCGLLDYP